MQSEQQSVKSTKIILTILFLIVFIDQASVFMIVPFFPDLLQELTHQDLAQNSLWAGWIITCYSAMQFIFSPIIGNLSDRFGRRTVLMLSMLFFSLDYVIMALSTNIWVLFIGRSLSGISGACVGTAMACVADISTDKDRAKNFGLLYGAIGIAFVLGPVIGSSLAVFGTRTPFWFAAVFCIFNAMVLFFFFPETLSKDKRQTTKLQNPAKTILKIAKHPGFNFLLIGHFFALVAFQAPIILWAFFTKEKFGWQVEQIGFSLGYLGLLICCVQLILVRFTYPILGVVKSIYTGFAFFILGFILLSLASTTAMLYLALIPYACGGIISSAISNLFSMNVSKQMQGQLQGVLASVTCLSAIVGPPIMTAIFYWAIKQQFVIGAGTPFLFAAGCFLLSWLSVYFGLRKVVKKTD